MVVALAVVLGIDIWVMAFAPAAGSTTSAGPTPLRTPAPRD